MDEVSSAEEIKCPVCFEIPVSEIFQCKNGHTICSQCCQDLQKCPECRVAYEEPKIRNRALEHILDKMKFECENKHLGCNMKIPRGEIISHSECCSYGSHGIKLCKMLGFSCSFLTNKMEIQSAVAHLQNVHNFFRLESNRICITFDSFPQLARNCNSAWKPPVLIDMSMSQGPILLILISFDPTHQTFSVGCLLLSNDVEKEPSSSTCQIQFTFKSANPLKVPDIIWSTFPMGIKFANEAIKHPPFQFSMNHLISNYIIEGSLKLKCSLVGSSTIGWSNEAVVHCTHYQIPGSRIKNVQTQPSVQVPTSTSTPSFQHNFQVFSSNEPVIFNKIACNICKEMPIDLFYKCMECKDYDLCQPCKLSGVHHQHHIFAVIRNKKQFKLFKKTIRKKFAIVPTRPQGPIVANIAGPSCGTDNAPTTLPCSACTAGTTKYICMQCHPIYGNCESCFLSTSYQHFEDQHHFFSIVDRERSFLKILNYLNTDWRQNLEFKM